MYSALIVLAVQSTSGRGQAIGNGPSLDEPRLSGNEVWTTEHVSISAVASLRLPTPCGGKTDFEDRDLPVTPTRCGIRWRLQEYSLTLPAAPHLCKAVVWCTNTSSVIAKPSRQHGVEKPAGVRVFD